MTPPYEQFSIQVLSIAGTPPIKVLGRPGFQGPAGTGTQGCGVSTPNAADVAAETAGFDIEVHIANGKTFTMGDISCIVAAGKFDVNTLFVGNTTKLLGAVPKEHIIWALAHTCKANLIPPFYHSLRLVFVHLDPFLRRDDKPLLRHLRYHKPDLLHSLV